MGIFTMKANRNKKSDYNPEFNYSNGIKVSLQDQTIENRLKYMNVTKEKLAVLQ
ncbi:hypothetical protein [Salipaludibacillus keqinensis]|uniref:hypothetical protein n=1 Tax=Salipaludibacillus keqinensis TaxID=2045207 RepID=UPI001304ED51|nr:hypothetical protein [Salipaludibacillus keqinensis]